MHILVFFYVSLIQIFIHACSRLLHIKHCKEQTTYQRTWINYQSLYYHTQVNKKDSNRKTKTDQVAEQHLNPAEFPWQQEPRSGQHHMWGVKGIADIHWVDTQVAGTHLQKEWEPVVLHSHPGGVKLMS